MGPFNTQCIFMQNGRSLISRICLYLSKNNMKYSQIQPYNILMSDGQKIYIEQIYGLNGVSIVKFSNNNNLRFNEAVI